MCGCLCVSLCSVYMRVYYVFLQHRYNAIYLHVGKGYSFTVNGTLLDIVCIMVGCVN